MKNINRKSANKKHDISYLKQYEKISKKENKTKNKLLSDFIKKSENKTDKQIARLRETLTKNLDKNHKESLNARKTLRAKYIEKVGGINNSISLKNIKKLIKTDNIKEEIKPKKSRIKAKLVQVGGKKGVIRYDYTLYHGNVWNAEYLLDIIDIEVTNLLFTKPIKKMYLKSHIDGINEEGERVDIYFSTHAVKPAKRELMLDEFYQYIESDNLIAGQYLSYLKKINSVTVTFHTFT